MHTYRTFRYMHHFGNSAATTVPNKIKAAVTIVAVIQLYFKTDQTPPDDLVQGADREREVVFQPVKKKKLLQGQAVRFASN